MPVPTDYSKVAENNVPNTFDSDAARATSQQQLISDAQQRPSLQREHINQNLSSFEENLRSAQNAADARDNAEETMLLSEQILQQPTPLRPQPTEQPVCIATLSSSSDTNCVDSLVHQPHFSLLLMNSQKEVLSEPLPNSAALALEPVAVDASATKKSFSHVHSANSNLGNSTFNSGICIPNTTATITANNITGNSQLEVEATTILQDCTANFETETKMEADSTVNNISSLLSCINNTHFYPRELKIQSATLPVSQQQPQLQLQLQNQPQTLQVQLQQQNAQAKMPLQQQKPSFSTFPHDDARPTEEINFNIRQNYAPVLRVPMSQEPQPTFSAITPTTIAPTSAPAALLSADFLQQSDSSKQHVMATAGNYNTNPPLGSTAYASADSAPNTGHQWTSQCSASQVGGNPQMPVYSGKKFPTPPSSAAVSQLKVSLSQNHIQHQAQLSPQPFSLPGTVEVPISACLSNLTPATHEKQQQQQQQHRLLEQQLQQPRLGMPLHPGNPHHNGTEQVGNFVSEGNYAVANPYIAPTLAVRDGTYAEGMPLSAPPVMGNNCLPCTNSAYVATPSKGAPQCSSANPLAAFSAGFPWAAADANLCSAKTEAGFLSTTYASINNSREEGQPLHHLPVTPLAESAADKALLDLHSKMFSSQQEKSKNAPKDELKQQAPGVLTCFSTPADRETAPVVPFPTSATTAPEVPQVLTNTEFLCSVPCPTNAPNQEVQHGLQPLEAENKEPTWATASPNLQSQPRSREFQTLVENGFVESKSGLCTLPPTAKKLSSLSPEQNKVEQYHSEASPNAPNHSTPSDDIACVALGTKMQTNQIPTTEYSTSQPHACEATLHDSQCATYHQRGSSLESTKSLPAQSTCETCDAHNKKSQNGVSLTRSSSDSSSVSIGYGFARPERAGHVVLPRLRVSNSRRRHASGSRSGPLVLPTKSTHMQKQHMIGSTSAAVSKERSSSPRPNGGHQSTSKTNSMLTRAQENYQATKTDEVRDGGAGRNNGSSDTGEDDEGHRVIQVDPSGRFECWDICIGKGAYKEVYKAFDTEEGVEVAWNQLRMDAVAKKELTKVFSEVELLQSLQHENIINIFHVWTSKGTCGRDRVYFITELMTSGNLKSFIRKTNGFLKPKVIKNLCRHILRGLSYLHSRTPPIIHRDLKCDNIFFNGNNGVAKIGDLGLATMKRSEHACSVLGTPEFMAPELYDEKYDERVDIYAFGMCVLELVTKEYPYQECANQAQIYKKVTCGVLPLALSRVQDESTRDFIELCIRHDYRTRPTAPELLEHPFLALAPTTATESNGQANFLLARPTNATTFTVPNAADSTNLSNIASANSAHARISSGVSAALENTASVTNEKAAVQLKPLDMNAISLAQPPQHFILDLLSDSPSASLQKPPDLEHSNLCAENFELASITPSENAQQVYQNMQNIPQSATVVPNAEGEPRLDKKPELLVSVSLLDIDVPIAETQPAPLPFIPSTVNSTFNCAPLSQQLLAETTRPTTSSSEQQQQKTPSQPSSREFSENSAVSSTGVPAIDTLIQSIAAENALTQSRTSPNKSPPSGTPISLKTDPVGTDNAERVDPMRHVGFDPTIHMCSFEPESTQVVLRMILLTYLAGGEVMTQSLKFPVNVTCDCPTEIVSEMLREGVLKDIHQQERVEVERMMRNVLIGPVVREAVESSKVLSPETIEKWRLWRQREALHVMADTAATKLVSASGSNGVTTGLSPRGSWHNERINLVPPGSEPYWCRGLTDRRKSSPLAINLASKASQVAGASTTTGSSLEKQCNVDSELPRRKSEGSLLRKVWNATPPTEFTLKAHSFGDVASSDKAKNEPNVHDIKIIQGQDNEKKPVSLENGHDVQQQQQNTAPPSTASAMPNHIKQESQPAPRPRTLLDLQTEALTEFDRLGPSASSSTAQN